MRKELTTPINKAFLLQDIDYKKNKFGKWQCLKRMFKFKYLYVHSSFTYGEKHYILYVRKMTNDAFIIYGYLDQPISKIIENNTIFFNSLDEFLQRWNSLENYVFQNYLIDGYKKGLLKYINYDYLNKYKDPRFTFHRLFKEPFQFITKKITDKEYHVIIKNKKLILRFYTLGQNAQFYEDLIMSSKIELIK